MISMLPQAKTPPAILPQAKTQLAVISVLPQAKTPLAPTIGNNTGQVRAECCAQCIHEEPIFIFIAT